MNTAAIATDWDQKALLELVTIRSGQVDPRDATYRDLPLIAPDHLTSKTGRLIKKESAAAQGAISGKYLVRPGDVIYSKIRPYLQKAYKCDFVALCSADMYPLTPRPGVDSSFVLHSILGHDFTTFAVSVSARSGIPKINRDDLAEYRMRVPEGGEQRVIGQALDDADHSIAMLERLITKKQAIKQGMMQELLTGRTRLPGFDSSWSAVELGDLTEVVSGGTPSSSVQAFWDGGIPWATPTDITNESGRYLSRTERTISRAGLEHSAARLLPAGSLLLCTRATVGEVKIAAVPTATNQGFKSLVPHSGVSSTFLYYKVLTLKDVLTSKGSGSTFLEVSKRDVAKLLLEVPDTSEQIAIATALTDADDEIDCLTVRLSKARDIKQGMMQELLTGRTRLPVEEAAA